MLLSACRLCVCVCVRVFICVCIYDECRRVSKAELWLAVPHFSIKHIFNRYPPSCFLILISPQDLVIFAQFQEKATSWQQHSQLAFWPLTWLGVMWPEWPMRSLVFYSDGYADLLLKRNGEALIDVQGPTQTKALAPSDRPTSVDTCVC